MMGNVQGKSHRTVTRREFIEIGAVGGSLLIGISVQGCGAGSEISTRATVPFEPNVYVRIDPDGTVTVTVPSPELGQGVRTSLPMIVAEELGADLSRVVVEQASASSVYGGMTVAGSDSIVDYWDPLREAGAVARHLFIEAAAERWGVLSDSCNTTGGKVVHVPTGRKLEFRELLLRASQLPAPTTVSLKDVQNYEIIGTRVSRSDLPAMVNGTAEYGLDVRIPNMRYAVVERSPVHGATVRSFDPSGAMAVEGVQQVIRIDPLVVGGLLYGAVRAGVAVIASNTWAAIKGREALEIEWDLGSNADQSTSSLRGTFVQLAKRPGATRLREEGDVDASLKTARRTVEAEYELPALARVCMEPMNFTADARDRSCEAWGPTQTPRMLRAVMAAALGLPRASVQVHPTLAGGGFGRRLAFDYGIEAAMVSRAAKVPVQVVWTREDDIRQDYYRTPNHHRMRAGIDESGRVVAWHHHVLATSLVRNSQVDTGSSAALYDVQGAADVPYDPANMLIEFTPVEFGLQMGSWRSVSHSFNVFAVNSFVDEIAAAAGRDPLEVQLELLGEPREFVMELPLPGRRGRPVCDTGRLRNVLQAAAERGNWGDALPTGWGRGIACTYYKKTYAAHVAEVFVSADGAVSVRRIVAAVDCGLVVDPSGAEAQIEGAAMDGVATVLKWGITVDRGRVNQSNFHDYLPLRINEAPEVEAHLMNSDNPPSGMGEPPYPSVAPAITNAVFAATGKRIRRLPIASSL